MYPPASTYVLCIPVPSLHPPVSPCTPLYPPYPPVSTPVPPCIPRIPLFHLLYTPVSPVSPYSPSCIPLYPPCTPHVSPLLPPPPRHVDSSEPLQRYNLLDSYCRLLHHDVRGGAFRAEAYVGGVALAVGTLGGVGLGGSLAVVTQQHALVITPKYPHETCEAEVGGSELGSRVQG